MILLLLPTAFKRVLLPYNVEGALLETKVSIVTGMFTVTGAGVGVRVGVGVWVGVGVRVGEGVGVRVGVGVGVEVGVGGVATTVTVIGISIYDPAI